MNYLQFLNEEYKYKDDFQKILNFYNSMKDYKYGFYAKGKKYTDDILDKPNIFDNYRTMSSDMIKKYKVCVCWDAVKYEAEWFKENVPNIKYKCYYCEYEPKIGNTHTWLVFEYNGEKYVFEKTWYSHRGIKKVNIKNKNTINQYISDIPKSDYSSNELKNAKYVLFEYDPLKEKNGLSCSEFMDNKWFNGKLLKTNCKDKKELFNTFEFNDKEKELLMKKSFLNEEYERPYSMKEIRKNYGDDYYNKLKNDPVHRWRAETGIELIHKEPSKEELERIMKNWESMDDRRKRLSDKKSMEVFGCSNKDNYNKLINTYNETNLDTLIFSPESIIQKEVNYLIPFEYIYYKLFISDNKYLLNYMYIKNLKLENSILYKKSFEKNLNKLWSMYLNECQNKKLKPTDKNLFIDTLNYLAIYKYNSDFVSKKEEINAFKEIIKQNRKYGDKTVYSNKYINTYDETLETRLTKQ